MYCSNRGGGHGVWAWRRHEAQGENKDGYELCVSHIGLLNQLSNEPDGFLWGKKRTEVALTLTISLSYFSSLSLFFVNFSFNSLALPQHVLYPPHPTQRTTHQPPCLPNFVVVQLLQLTQLAYQEGCTGTN